MTVSLSLIIFVLLIIMLSAMRHKLVYEISGTSLLIFGTTKPGLTFYTLFFLPGTIIHELSHWIAAEILQVRTGQITIFPELGPSNGETQRLGSVATAKSDPLRGFLIGLAPFLTGLGILFVLGQIFAFNLVWWQLILIIYGVVVIGNSMMISESDRRTWPFIIIFITLITIVLVRMNLAVPPNFYLLTSNVLYSLNLILGVTAGVNLVMIGGSYALRKLVERVSGKRITNR